MKHKISVAMVWLDYQKAFDSVPLAKVPPLVISATET